MELRRCGWKAHDGNAYRLQFNRDYSLLASSGFDAKVKLWDTSDWHEVRKIKFWDMKTGHETRTISPD